MALLSAGKVAAMGLLVGVCLLALVSSARADCTSNTTKCKDCVGLVGKCAFCKNPTDGRTYCASSCGSCPNGDCFQGQCEVNKHDLLYIVLPSVGGALLIIFGITCWCCCRKRTKRRIDRSIAKDNARFQQQSESRAAASQERRTEREERNAAIREKYGLQQPLLS